MAKTAEELAAEKEAEAKLLDLRTLQNRIMGVEADVKKYKGADAETIRAIAKDTVKDLEAEIERVKASLTPAPASPAAKDGPSIFSLEYWTGD